MLFAALIGGFALGQAAPNVQFFATGMPAVFLCLLGRASRPLLACMASCQRGCPAPTGKAAAARVFAIIGRQPVIADPKPTSPTGGAAQSKNAELPASCRGAVEFRSVTFACEPVCTCQLGMQVLHSLATHVTCSACASASPGCACPSHRWLLSRTGK